MKEVEYTRTLGQPTVFWRDTPSNGLRLSSLDMAMYFRRGTPRFSYSFFDGVRVLPPGHRLTINDRLQSFDRVWTPVDGQRWSGVKQEEIARQIRETLTASVTGLAAGHKRIGLFLSGGLDSTILASLLKQTGAEIICYVCQFPDFPVTDETHYARMAADRYGLQLKVVKINRETFAALLKKILSVKDRPLTCWSAIPQLAVSQQAAEDQCDILFSGVGSDELFTGYSLMGHKYKAFLEYERHNGEGSAWEVLLGPASPARSEILFMGNATPFSYELIQELMESPPERSFFEEDVVEFYRSLHQRHPEADIASLMSAWEAELRTSEMLYPDYLTAERITGMRVVYPFYTTKMVSAFNNIPLDLRFKFSHEGMLRHFPKVYQGIDKYILRLAFEDVLPVDIQARARMAFSAPFAWWLQEADYRGGIEHEVVHHPVWKQIGVRQETLKKLFSGVDQPTLLNQWQRPFQLWLLYMVCQWADKKEFPMIKIYGT
ncbi:asparagine synthase C-terminal domain-containing protein [Fulvivirgaceae bacterium PWU4]|uniref:asparagine synthase (glutamine-hydrolyzing) n=1 Tax=Chryseosolibacter histidini TaxID=2782349 RepID=A0AAP2GMC4_9BACT|nr:asparagine synthase C-terminal domain-containing protein [Chryseosolibacter histidini]MBT1695470.1 asparagine synthase C-terminal domain-containing protein [Chryseosolibacter histidini]